MLVLHISVEWISIQNHSADASSLLLMEDLWLPIFVASALCLVISVLAWRVLPHHKREHLRVPTEPQLLEALRIHMPAPGLYSFPYQGVGDANASRADVAANRVRGPVGYMVIGAARPTVSAWRLVQQFLFFAVVATLTAFVATLAGLKDGAAFLSVLRVAGTVATMSLVLGAVPQSIWFYRPWKSWALQFADGLVCGVTMGVVFGWYRPR